MWQSNPLLRQLLPFLDQGAISERRDVLLGFHRLQIHGSWTYSTADTPQMHRASGEYLSPLLGGGGNQLFEMKMRIVIVEAVPQHYKGFIANIFIRLQSLECRPAASISWNAPTSQSLFWVNTSREYPSILIRTGFTSVIAPVSAFRCFETLFDQQKSAWNTIFNPERGCAMGLVQ